MSARTSKNWKKYTPEMRARLRFIDRNRKSLIAALENAGVDLSKIRYRRMVSAGGVIKAKFKGSRKPVVFITFRGLVEIARELGIQWESNTKKGE